MLPLWIAAVGQGLAQREQQKAAEEEKRKQSISNISGKFAAQMGMPTSRIEAARTQYEIDQDEKNAPGMDYMKMYMDSQKRS